MKKYLSKILRKLTGVDALQAALERNHEELMTLYGKSLSLQLKKLDSINNLKDAEFKVFSQFGDDGIIQWLIHQLNLNSDSLFVEFGVQNYYESNTRFLLKNDNWNGVVIDGSSDFINFIKKDDIHWKYNLRAYCNFITAENIESLLLKYSNNNEIDLLSIDIDGNDYWIFNSLKSIRPKIIICEYNSLFGEELEVSVPYDPKFVRSEKHFSNLYFGCSIKALIKIANEKGYCFLGTNSNGNNAYFIDLKYKSVKDKIYNSKIYNSKFRESRNEFGELTFLDKKESLKLISHLELIDLKTNKIVKVSDLL